MPYVSTKDSRYLARLDQYKTLQTTTAYNSRQKQYCKILRFAAQKSTVVGSNIDCGSRYNRTLYLRELNIGIMDAMPREYVGYVRRTLHKETSLSEALEVIRSRR